MNIDLNDFMIFVCERYGIDIEDALKNDSFEELGVDSLSLYSLVDEVEKNYNIKIDTDDITEINEIKKLYNYISSKVEAINDSKVDS